MAKGSGLGDRLYVGGYNISNDVGSIGSISNAMTPLETTGIDKSATERVIGQRTGTIEYTGFFNDASNREHDALKALPTTDKVVTYFHGAVIGNAAASMVAKQINYDWTRGADGSLTFQVQALSNGYGVEWGNMLTTGVRTDNGATNGASWDTGASLSFGAQAYLQAFLVSGATDVTVKIQDSADDVSFSDVTGLAFTQITGGTPLTERIATSNTATIRRYVRAITVTTGGFTSLQYAVMIVKNDFAGLVF